MKLGILSDLHIDKNSESLLLDYSQLESQFINYLKKKKDTVNIDALLIPGDISDSMTVSLNFLNKLKSGLNIPIYFVPGNHDIYQNNPLTSKDQYQMYLDSEFNIVNKEIYLTEKTSLIGGYTWYDYSLYADYLQYSDIKEDLQQRNNRILARKQSIGDNKYVTHINDDVAYATSQILALRNVLKKSEAENIIVMNHFIGFNHPRYYKKDNDNWNIVNSFMGSIKIETMLRDYNVNHYLSGHTHIRTGDFKSSDITVMSNPLGYVREWDVKDVETELDKAFKTIHID